jgi:hypothetical protein
MAKSEVQKDSLYVLVVKVIGSRLKVIPECGVLEIDILYLRSISPLFFHGTVGEISASELFEFHDVAGKRACFIREHILYLTQFFIQIG